MSSTARYIAALLLVIAPLALGALDAHQSNNEFLKDIGQQPSESLTLTETAPSSEQSHQSRLGFVTYGSNDMQGMSSVNPMKIELGGVFLGTLIGLGIVLLAPKVSELFNHQQAGQSAQYHGGYSRSGDQDVLSGLTKVMSKIDGALHDNNIDSMACLERAVCTYVQSRQQTAAGLTNSSNQLVNFFIDGSRLKSALERGLSGDNCSLVYPQCSFSKSALVAGVRTLMAGNSL